MPFPCFHRPSRNCNCLFRGSVDQIGIVIVFSVVQSAKQEPRSISRFTERIQSPCKATEFVSPVIVFMIVREFLYQSLEMIGYSAAVLDRAQDVNGISYTNHCDELFTRILCSLVHRICVGFVLDRARDLCGIRARSGTGFVWDSCSLGHRICVGFVVARPNRIPNYPVNFSVRSNRIPDYPKISSSD